MTEVPHSFYGAPFAFMSGGIAMTTIADQQKVWEIELYHVGKEAFEKGYKEGFEEVLNGIREEARIDLLRRMLERTSLQQVSEAMGIPQDEIMRLVASADEKAGT